MDSFSIPISFAISNPLELYKKVENFHLKLIDKYSHNPTNLKFWKKQTSRENQRAKLKRRKIKWNFQISHFKCKEEIFKVRVETEWVAWLKNRQIILDLDILIYKHQIYINNSFQYINSIESDTIVPSPKISLQFSLNSRTTNTILSHQLSL
jgi:hypothetical protein